jgi:hypothetical protein
VPLAVQYYRFKTSASHSDHFCLQHEGVSKSFRAETITKYMLTTINSRWEAKQKVMAGKLTRITHRIVLGLQLVADSCTICSSRSRRPVRKLWIHPQTLLESIWVYENRSNFQNRVVRTPTDTGVKRTWSFRELWSRPFNNPIKNRSLIVRLTSAYVLLVLVRYLRKSRSGLVSKSENVKKIQVNKWNK